MRWNVSIAGNPDTVKKALKTESGKLAGDQKKEFEAVKPHLEAIVALHHDADPNRMVKCEVSGDAVYEKGKRVSGHVSVIIEQC